MRTIWIRSPITYASVVHSTWPSRAMWRTHAPTFNKWHKKKKKKNMVTLHMLTHGPMWGCELTSLVVCINGKLRDIRKRNVTRSEFWTTNIRPLGSRDMKECVTLWRLTLRGLGCTGPILGCKELHDVMRVHMKEACITSRVCFVYKLEA